MDLAPTAAVARVLRVDPSVPIPAASVPEWKFASGEVGAVGWSEALEALAFLRRWVEEREAALVAGAHRDGWPAAEVARLLGVDRRRMSERFRSLALAAASPVL